MSQSIRIPLPENPNVLPWIARLLLLAERRQMPPEVLAEQMNAPAPVLRILKSGVPAAVSSDSTWAGSISGDYSLAIQAYLENPANPSAFLSIWAANGFLALPFYRRVGLSATSATAALTGNGLPTPISRLSLTNMQLTPHTVSAILVASDSVLEDIGPSGQRFFNRMLRAAVAVEADSLFFSDCLSGSFVEDISARGADAESARAAMRDALRILQPTATSRLWWIAAPDVAVSLATLSDTAGAAAFAGVGPAGGTLLGSPLVLSDGVPASTLVLADTSRICANADQIAMAASSAATLQMDTTPTNNAATGVGSTQVSLYQTKSTALRVSLRMGCTLLDDTAVVSISNIDWGSAASA